MHDTPQGEVRNRLSAPAVTVTTESGDLPLDDVLDGLGGGPAEVTTSQISDATATGRELMTAATDAAARSAIGAGTSSLALGTTASTAAAGNHTHPGLLSGSAQAVADAAAAPTQAEFNALLSALRARGVISGG